MTRKFYISYEKKERECGICRLVKPFREFPMYKGMPKTYCKKCRSAQVLRKYMEKKIEVFPNLYYDCDECDHIWCKRKSDACPKCGTKKEIEA